MKKSIVTKKIIYALALLFFFAAPIYFYRDAAIQSVSIIGNYLPILEAKLPSERTNPKNVTLNCNFRNQEEIITLTLHENVSDYYKNRRSKPLDISHKKYASEAKGDETLNLLVGEIERISKQKNLTRDDTLDLAGCFLQSIPYDQEKANLVLSDQTSIFDKKILPRYPYETLFDLKGICTDKTFVAVSVFEKLGFGSGIFLLPDLKHMAPGITVPNDYGSYKTGYAIFEQTNSGYRIGDIPRLTPEGLADENIYGQEEVTLSATIDRQDVIIPGDINRLIPFSEGTVYEKIVTSKKLKSQIESMSKKLEIDRAQVDAQIRLLETAEGDLKRAEISLRKFGSSYYPTYNSIYKQYLRIYNQTKVMIDAHNRDVKELNSFVDSYNNL